MKIQEMKSGILHLTKKMEDERRENLFEVGQTGPAVAIPEDDDVDTARCELDEPLWSVVSFDRREAVGLTYARATEVLAQLDSHGFAGLCIITDLAAGRIRPTRKP